MKSGLSLQEEEEVNKAVTGILTSGKHELKLHSGEQPGPWEWEREQRSIRCGCSTERQVGGACRGEG